MQSNIALFGASTAGLTSAYWMPYLQPAYQIMVGVITFVVLILTLSNKWMEFRERRARRQISEQQESRHAKS